MMIECEVPKCMCCKRRNVQYEFGMQDPITSTGKTFRVCGVCMSYLYNLMDREVSHYKEAKRYE